MENKKSKIIIFLCVISIICNAILLYMLYASKNEISSLKQQNTRNYESIKNDSTDTNKQNDSSTILLENTIDGEEEYKFELKQGNVYVTTKNGNKLLSRDVVSAYVLHYGKTDVGDDRVLFMIKKDGSLSYYKIADVTVSSESDYKVIDNLGNLVGVSYVYNVEEKGKIVCLDDSYYGEPSLYKVFALNSDGNSIDISNYLK